MGLDGDKNRIEKDIMGGTCCLQQDIYKAVLSNWVIIIAEYNGNWTSELNFATQEEG